MYDFSKFIDLLNQYESDPQKALNIIKDDFPIGKIRITSDSFTTLYDFNLADGFNENFYVDYSNQSYRYFAYAKKDIDSFSPKESKGLKTLLRLLSLNHMNYELDRKARKSELTNAFTKLHNVHGYLKFLDKKLKEHNSEDYNAYFINIKGFGLINKLYGPKEGDNAIIAYANSLKGFADDEEVVGHLGADNFVAFIKKTRHDDFINLVTKCPICINNSDHILVGVVGYYELGPNEDSQNIMSNTSMACSNARINKKIVVKYTQALEDFVNSVKTIESSFKSELEKGNYIVYYQPKYDIKSGKIYGVEALSRWAHDGKILPPGVFVPILEKSGEIIHLDLHILETLCKDIHNYRNMGYRIVPASCNLSRRDFENENLEEIIIGIIKKYNVRTEDIVLEVTETTNFEENKRLDRFIKTMNKNGILTAIDDFGTGYSSLSVIRDFKVSEIKIDRSFIDREHLTKKDEIIIGSIINMAKNLDISIVCEGVETKEQAEFLSELGCKNAQGYLYCKPLPKLEFEALMQKTGTVYDDLD